MCVYVLLLLVAAVVISRGQQSARLAVCQTTRVLGRVHLL